MIKEGVTGFGHEDLAGLGKKIENLKNEILSANRFKIIETEDQTTSNNFIRIRFYDLVEHSKIDILINAPYGYTCGVTCESSWMNLHFIELPIDLISKLESNGFQYLNPEYLNLNIDDMDIRKLSKSERDQVAYWESKIKGYVIFNGYD